MNREPFADGEFYHVYNRGVDKRKIFLSGVDFERFLRSMKEFNSIEPIGSLYAKSFSGSTAKSGNLVDIVAYCLNMNHFHFILQQCVQNGISEFMKRLSGGYTWYFNNRQKRSGALFQGRFKAVHINSNPYLLYLSAYVNLNNRAHKAGDAYRSSWNEYIESKKRKGVCKKGIIFDQFKGVAEYKEFSKETLESILEGKALRAELEDLLFHEE